MIKIYQITEDCNKDTIKNSLEGEFEYFYLPCKSEEGIIQKCRDADVLISIYEPITKKVMDELKNLKYIALGSIGYNMVDAEYAARKNILLSNNPAYCIEEVADHTMALILNLLRRISIFNKSVKEDKIWDYNLLGNSLRRISSLKAGIIGFGSIGRLLAKRLKAFDSTVYAYDPYVADEVFKSAGVLKANLEDIEKNCDIISIHLPLLEETYNIIDRDFLNKLEKKPILINCSRGGLIDQEDLEEALEKNLITGLGLDVLADENPDLASLKFLKNENLIITPHVAFYSRESIEEADSNVGKYISSFMKNDFKNIPLIGK
ncbi:C-terminal binding protein [Peptoniphilus raoultii]|uniref:C-terminal binding protein n=1 Tax=Peptoniphilus raoultii TaxID=1776387 RepID=UPI0009F4CC22|nr:C-terminal binding protein [Peptoniphilus raoultii]